MGCDEQLDAKDANIVKRVQYLGSQKHRIRTLGRGERRRDSCRVQDAVAVDVFAGIETGDGTINAAGSDDGNFAFECDESFQNSWGTFEGGIGGWGVFAAVQAGLAFAIIAETAGFQDRGRADLGAGAGQIIKAIDGAVWGHL